MESGRQAFPLKRAPARVYQGSKRDRQSLDTGGTSGGLESQSLEGQGGFRDTRIARISYTRHGPDRPAAARASLSQAGSKLKHVSRSVRNNENNVPATSLRDGKQRSSRGTARQNTRVPLAPVAVSENRLSAYSPQTPSTIDSKDQSRRDIGRPQSSGTLRALLSRVSDDELDDAPVRRDLRAFP